MGERNCSTGHPFTVDAERGIVYGVRGKPLHKTCSSGYILAMYGSHSARRYLRAHVIVWESVFGPVPGGQEINHINGIKTDNRIANLEAVTHSENVLHAYRTGLMDNRATQAGKNHRAKLTEDQIHYIRASKEGCRELAERYGVWQKTIRNVRNWRSWKYIGSPGHSPVVR